MYIRLFVVAKNIHKLPRLTTSDRQQTMMGRVSQIIRMESGIFSCSSHVDNDILKLALHKIELSSSQTFIWIGKKSNADDFEYRLIEGCCPHFIMEVYFEVRSEVHPPTPESLLRRFS